jgi:hypothetical protein
MADDLKQALSLEVCLPGIPDGINVYEQGGNMIFRVDGKATCYLEKRFIYRLDMEGAVSIEEVRHRLIDAVNDFNAQLGTTANVLGKQETNNG